MHASVHNKVDVLMIGWDRPNGRKLHDHPRFAMPSHPQVCALDQGNRTVNAGQCSCTCFGILLVCECLAACRGQEFRSALPVHRFMLIYSVHYSIFWLCMT